MHTTLIVARMQQESRDDVASIFKEFDQTEMPHLMGTSRRQLFTFHGLYFHLQEFDSDRGGAAIEETKNHPRFVQVSSELNPFITA